MIYDGLKDLIDFIVEPFLQLIEDIGLKEHTIKVGFGSVEWFSFELYDLINLILSFMVIFIFMKLVYRLLKMVANLITGGYFKL